MAFCNSCGVTMEEGVKFCPGCGKPSSDEAAATSAAPAATAAAGGNDNVMGGLAYLLIPAIIFLVMEPYSKNPFIRFHSFQSLFLCAASIVIQIGFGIISAILSFLAIILVPVGMLLSLAFFGLWVYSLIQAFQGKEFRIPVIGDLAAKQV